MKTRDREQWLAQLREMTVMADRTRLRLANRARVVMAEAHCSFGPDHNALIAFNQGRPWKGVNYSLLRRARWLMERSWEPDRIVHRWYSRTYGEVRFDVRRVS